MKCRHCDTELVHTFLDLGYAPPSNAYLSVEDLTTPETYYPLKIRVCDECWLVQTEDYTDAGDLFSADYAYFSSTSTGWLAHSEKYTHKMIQDLSLSSDSFVIEVASNDGYLLKNFLAADIPCLGIEPTASTAEAAIQIGVPVMQEFFGEAIAKRLAKEGKQADLIAGNNVYAHVPDINDFSRGLKEALKPGGTVTLEFPHLMKLIEYAQFDTVYHEHFSYLSLYTVSRIFESVGLRVWDVEELTTHGGSLRVYGCHASDNRENTHSVGEILTKESNLGMRDLAIYEAFQIRADQIKNNLLRFFLDQKESGKIVVAYGAAAKGNTLLNYAGIKTDLLPFVYDAAKAKQGKFMPGSHIPILPPSLLVDAKPDYVVILPWNIASEVMKQLGFLQEFGTKFVTAVPSLEIT
jgi:SAM-dependent methyltransferase